MEDRDIGAGSPEAGVPGGFAAASAGETLAGRTDTSSAISGEGAQHPKGKGKRRRKRKRGRKVFARDGVAQQGIAAARPLPEAAAVAQPARPTVSEIGDQPRGPRVAKPYDLPVFAALDLGTNNCRLLVAVPGRRASSASSTRSRASCGWARGCRASGRLGAGGDGPRRRGAEDLRRQAAQPRASRSARLIATEACRAAAQRRRVPGAGRRRNRADAGDHRPPDRGAACRVRLRVAGRARDRWRRAVRHRRRLVGDRADRHVAAQRSPRLANHIVVLDLAAGRRRLAGRALWRPRRDAARSSRPWSTDVAGMLGAFDGRDRLEPSDVGRGASTCSARPAR